MKTTAVIRLFAMTTGFALLSPLVRSESEIIVAAWHGAVGEAQVQARGIVAANNLEDTDWRQSGESSGTGSYGNFPGAPLGPEYPQPRTFALGSFQVPATTGDKVQLEFVITNRGSANYELTAVRFDGWKNHTVASTVQIQILEGGSITAATLRYPELSVQGKQAEHNSKAWDSRDIDLTRLRDNILEAGGSFTIRLTALHGAAPTVWIDNLAITGKRLSRRP